MFNIANQRGSVLVGVLAVILVATILGLALARLSLNDMTHAMRHEKGIEAYYIARSGAEAVAAHLLKHPEDLQEFVDREPELVHLGQGSFVVGVFDRDGAIVIESIGRAGRYERRVTLSLLPAVPILDMAVFARSSMGLTNFATIHGSAGTNSALQSTVQFSNFAQVTGNFYTGGDDPLAVIKPYGGYGHIVGELGVLDEERAYPLPEFPTFPNDLPRRGSVNLWGDMTHYIFDDGEYDQIVLSNNSHLFIDVGNEERRIRIRNFSAANNAKVSLIGSGKLLLFVDNQFQLSNFVTVNEHGNTNQVMLYYAGAGQFSPANNTQFIGSIYVKTADIQLSNFSNIVGSIISGGSRVSLSNHSQISLIDQYSAQIIYAPNAHVTMSNHATVKGAIVCNSFQASNHSAVYFSEIGWADIPLPETKPGLRRGYWK